MRTSPNSVTLFYKGQLDFATIAREYCAGGLLGLAELPFSQCPKSPAK
jgi:hypothetical protein